ncbi:uncharacterized protein LOC132563265 [Ylistrum balloti]|uniref:uncharacterized protein LOC132563265 n=1 Tax=Ylistrum balloti TaxID=509963 RepID=UPI002905DD56|nr:uncharacterized protein LOC132563265 [Ylistrum balloti]
MLTRKVLIVLVASVMLSMAYSEGLGNPTLSNLIESFNDLAIYIHDMESASGKDLRELENRVEELEKARKSDIHKFSESVLELQGLHEADKEAVRQLTDEMTELIAENKYILEEFHVTKQSFPFHSDKSRDIHSAPPKSVPLEMMRAGPSLVAVAFYAIMTRQMLNPGVHQNIVFDSIVTNVNAQISNYTGVFTCSQPGVHVFAWQTLLNDPDYVITELVRNGVALASEEIGNSGAPESGSSTAVLNLARTDEVWVRVAAHSIGADIQPHLTTFAGFRLP